MKLEARDAEALLKFAVKVRLVLGERLVRLKLSGSKARGEDVPARTFSSSDLTGSAPAAKKQPLI